MTARGRCAVRLMAATAVLAVITLVSDIPVRVLSARQEPAAAAQTAPATSQLSLEQQEEFLKKAKVLKTRGAGKGVTNTLRATLSDGTITHDASIQTVDVFMQEFKSKQGVEFNFRDSWRYNVAAYRMDRLLDIGMTPPSIERSHQNKPASFTWWVDDVVMDEGERLKNKTPAPNVDLWNEQMWVVRIFDQLIYNVDRNLGNLLIDKNWTVWMIDHSRAFRLFDKVKTPDNITKCERRVFEKLKALDAATVKAATGDYLTGPEIRGMLARRDELVKLIEKIGPSAFYDRRWVTTTQ
jgi:hypothetical protein